MISETLGVMRALRGMYETLAISAPTVLDSIRGTMTLDRGNQRLDRWSKRLLTQVGVEWTSSGQEHLRAGQPYVLMSNHQSHYDIPLMFQTFPGTLRMVAKTELFKVPIWGRAMEASGFIEVDRTNRERAIEHLRKAHQRLASGISVWIAPEGTRSRTGELLPFKKGGFVLAMETGTPIVPVGIIGSRNILPAKGAIVRTGAKVHVTYGAPVVPPRMDASSEARAALIAEVRTRIERAMDESRSALARRASTRESSVPTVPSPAIPMLE
jgi:1-acyl-sn-glycerol-3-phosphate acyltransferase